MPLLEGETVTYHGHYYSVDDLFIEPTASRRPEIWIGGGSQLADPKSPDLPRFVESVKARVLRTDGWIPRPTCPPAEIARDWRELQALLPRARPRPRRVRRRARELPAPRPDERPGQGARGAARAFLKVMSDERGPKYLESVYLFGTPDEIIASLQARVDAGVEYFILHTMTPDPAQLQAWVDEIIPNVTFPATAGPVRRHGARAAVTRRVALLGKPLRRRHSQVMHDAAFAAAGIDARYELLELEPDAVEGAVDGRARAGLARAAASRRRTSGSWPVCATTSKPTPRRSARSTTWRRRHGPS